MNKCHELVSATKNNSYSRESDKVQDVSAAIKKAIGGESKGVIIVTSVDDFIPF